MYGQPFEAMELDNLPDLALFKVFSFFSNQEKIKKLMLVCKRWYSFLQVDIQQLCVYERIPPYRLFWDFFSTKAIDNNCIVKMKELDQENLVFKFANLKKLCFYKVTHLHKFFLNQASFDQLVELKLVFNDYDKEVKVRSKN